MIYEEIQKKCFLKYRREGKNDYNYCKIYGKRWQKGRIQESCRRAYY